MPTKHSRIAVTRDPELAEAIERVRPLFDGKAASAVVRELAIRGAEAVLADEERRQEAIADILSWFDAPETAPWDWEVLARVEDEMLEAEGLPEAE